VLAPVLISCADKADHRLQKNLPTVDILQDVALAHRASANSDNSTQYWKSSLQLSVCLGRVKKWRVKLKNYLGNVCIKYYFFFSYGKFTRTSVLETQVACIIFFSVK
jgi:hypothetical protein